MTKSKSNRATRKAKWDKQLAVTATKMITAGRADKPLLPVLKRNCPEVHRQLTIVAAQPRLLGLWGRSENVDENAKREIVDPRILDLIGEQTGQEMTPPSVHAGLQHSYGYLFSLIETPYGFKRDRWTGPEVDDGFGFGRPTLRVKPAEGTLLTNLTYFLGRIAFRGRRREIAILRGYKSDVASCLTKFNYRRLKPATIIECFRFTRSATATKIHTELIQFQNPNDENSHFLIYWIEDMSETSAKLLTAFPVNENTFSELMRQKQGKRVQIRARFNGVIKGLNRKTRMGSREIVHLRKS